MSATPRSKLQDYTSPREALVDLCEGMMTICSHAADCFQIKPNDIPPPYHKLLVHDRHMTEVLGEHFGVAPELRVISYQQDGDLYSRKIILTPGISDKVVELGIVRLDLQYLDPPVKAEILARERPLGEVLIRHNVLRRVEPRWFFSFPPHCMEIREAGVEIHQRVYGRVGTIYFNEEPALEVLEIVTNV